MTRLAVSTLALALMAATGSAFAGDTSYDRAGYYGDPQDGAYALDADSLRDPYSLDDPSGNDDARYDARYDDSRYDDRYDDRVGYEAAYDRGNGIRIGEPYGDQGLRYDTAQVVSVDPILARSAPRLRQQCWSEPAGYRRDRYDDRYDARYDARYPRSGVNGGTVLGAIIGGALGNQTGRGDGKKAATIAGAVIGAAIGNQVAQDHDDYAYRDGRYERSRDIRQCRTVREDGAGEQRVVGYRVTYRYAGHTYHTTTSHHPGSSIRVQVQVRAEEEAPLVLR